MEKDSDPPQKEVLLDSSVYKSSLIYRPSDSHNAFQKRNYYEYEEDLEGQDDEKARLAGAVSEKKQRRRRSCALCCCTICYVVFILLLVAAIVIIKLIPKAPAVSLGDLNIKQFVYNESSNGARQIQASLSLGMNVTNRNPHADAIYKEISLTLFFNNESLGSFNGSPAPQFEQKKKTTTAVVEDLPRKTTTIENKANADSLTTQVADSNVRVNLTGSVRGTLKVLGMKVKKFDIDIMCQLNVKPGDGGSRAADKLSFSCYYQN